MRLRYEKADGRHKDIEIGERPLTIGRSGDADVMVLDEKVSRLHCGIGIDDGEVVIKDLQSKNGTFVNEERIERQALEPGDRIRIGSSVFVFEAEAVTAAGANTALMEMQDAFDGGKGYSTILREIVGTTGKSAAAAAEAPEESPAPQPEDAGAPERGISGKGGLRKKTLNVKVKQPPRDAE